MAKKGEYALADKINKEMGHKKTPAYVKALRKGGDKIEKQETKLAKERKARYKREGISG